MNKENNIVVVDASRKWYQLGLKEIWDYRDLLFLLIRREFVVKYKQTILGASWAVINPLMTTVVFTVIFGNLAKLSTADTNDMLQYVLPKFLFYMAGSVCWEYFSLTVKSVSNTFLLNARVMSKVYYPRILSPISVAIAKLATFGIQLLLFFLLLVIEVIRGAAVIRVSAALLLLPLLMLQLVLLGLGTGIIVSALTTKYRDMAMLVEFGLHLWQFASPVAYGFAIVPEKWRLLYLLNPVSEIVVSFR